MTTFILVPSTPLRVADRCDHCPKATQATALCDRCAEVLFGFGPVCSLPASAHQPMVGSRDRGEP